MSNCYDPLLFLSNFFKQEFQLSYQPILSLDKQRLSGFEALIAWQPDRAQIYSESPVTLVKESHLDLSFYELLFYEACRQMREWQHYHLADAPLQMHIDVPLKQLCKRDPLGYIKQSLENLQLTSKNIQLEIPAAWILEENSTVKFLMTQVRKMGLSICVDDLELSVFLMDFWKDMPIKTFKLSKGSVKSLSSNIGMQNSFQRAVSKIKKGTKILVQDVDSLDQLGFLQELGCTHGQSDVFSQLMSSRQATKLIQTYVRQQPKDLMMYLCCMNIISRMAENFLGRTTVIRYWKMTRPVQPWLVLIEPYKDYQEILGSTRLTKLTVRRQQDLRRWIDQFIQHCDLIFQDFSYLLSRAELSDFESRMMGVLLPDLF